MIASSPLSAKRRIKDRRFASLCLAAVLTCVAILVALLLKLTLDGYHRLSLSFIMSQMSRNPNQPGILTSLIGSLAVIAVTAVVAIPLGVGAAVWLEEFNTRRTRLSNFIQLNISNLAGVPSIVYGILGLAIFVRWLALGKSILSGGLTMGLLILPMVIIVSQEALRAVPSSYREGSLALGATRWQTISRQVLPAAFPGILTGIILSISRALGETAPLIVIGAAGYVGFLPKKLSDHYTVLPLQIYNWAKDPSPIDNANGATAILVLMILLLALNSVAIWLRARARTRGA
jgi:phosphate transport system permease protein